MVRYAEINPRMELRPWVRCIWTYEDRSPSNTVQRIPPDGCPELILHLGLPYEEERDGVFVSQPHAIFAGQMTRPIALRASGPIACVGLRFHPDGAWPWLGAPLSEATDLRLDVGHRLTATRAADIESAIDLLEDSVTTALLVRNWPLDQEIRDDVLRLRGQGETADAADSAERRRLQRLYLKLVGVSEQTLASIFRFRRVFDRAAEAGGASWLTVALDAGYFDQPQMARDFRRFMGCTATEWAREQIELGRAISSYPSA